MMSKNENVLPDEIKWDIALELLGSLLQTEYGATTSQMIVYDLMSKTPNLKMGHYALPCFHWTKYTTKNPVEIAQELQGKFNASSVHRDLISEVRTAGPYLNIFVNMEFLGKNVVSEMISGEYFNQELVKNAPKTMVEYSQPNTHKELHVGHMRNLCLGDAVVKLHRYAGFEVISSTFPGDVGTHVAKCLWYMQYKNTEPVPETKKGEWLGKMYSAANNLLEEEKDTDKFEDNKAKLSEILRQLEQQEGKYFDLWKETREWSIKLMKEAYDWADVQFDHWYWESEVDSSSLKLAKEYYEKGLLVESQGVIGIDLSEEDLGFCVLIKSDGNGLYATKDLELARRKFEDYDVEKNIYVVDMRQEHHFKQVFSVLKHMGYENADKCYHLKYNYVELPEGAMSSRKGTIVPLFDLINQMEEITKKELMDRYEGEWEMAEIDKVANIVAKGAIKYGMLKMDPNKKIVFDMKEWLKMDGDSGPYLQYAYVRINSLCQKLAYDESAAVDWSALKEEKEIALLLKLADFNNVVLGAVEQYRPNMMTTYLFELSKAYNSFWNAHSVKDAEADVKQARLGLSKAVSVVLKKGLELLGIPVPERM